MKVITGCAVLLVSVALASANLLTNPGFENGGGDLSGWDQSGWYAGSGGDAHSGTYGLAYAVPDGRPQGDYYVAAQYVPVTAGLTYDASMWLRTVGNNESESFLEVVFHDSTGGWIGQHGTTPVAGETAYTQYTLDDLVAPAGAVTASVRAVVHTTAVTTSPSWQTFDDFSLAAIPEPGTLALCLVGAAGYLVRRRRQKNG